MLRLSPDHRRLYVSNSLLTPWDDDPDFGPARNDDYGIWLFDVDKRSGELTHTGAQPWVSSPTSGGRPQHPLEPGEH